MFPFYPIPTPKPRCASQDAIPHNRVAMLDPNQHRFTPMPINQAHDPILQAKCKPIGAPDPKSRTCNSGNPMLKKIGN
jgi:hypothetical protein